MAEVVIENQNTDTAAPPATDYERLYNEMKAQRDALSRKSDAMATENKQLKEKNRALEDAQLSEAEKAERVRQEELERTNAIEAELNKYKQKDKLLSCGYTAEEAQRLMDANCSPEVFYAISVERETAARAKAEALSIKNGTNAPSGSVGTAVPEKKLQDYSMAEMNALKTENPELYKKLIS